MSIEQVIESNTAALKERLAMFESSLQTLQDMTQLQCTDGTWNYDSYMHGMANGMIFALSLFEAGEPKFLDAPTEWLKDRNYMN